MKIVVFFKYSCLQEMKPKGKQTFDKIKRVDSMHSPGWWNGEISFLRENEPVTIEDLLISFHLW